jgi:hypothetical protein
MLDICLAYSADFAARTMLEGEHWTDERLEYDEWEAIFYFELMGYCPFVSRAKPVDTKTWHDLWKRGFQEAIPDYPLLARMWNAYEDAFYAPEEIENLRIECLRVQTKTENVLALKGLDKLLKCCDKAVKENIGLFMACD